MKNWFSIRACKDNAEISIYEEIGAFGVSAKDFLAELRGIRDAAYITVRINSPGGSVFDGIAIYNALKRYPARVTIIVDGIAASIASVIICAGDEIIMPENAMLMLHEPSAVVAGTADDLLSMAAALEKMRISLVSAYRGKSGLPDTEIKQLLANETWLSAQEALDFGFADRIEAPVKMAAHFDLTRFHNAPENLTALPTPEKEFPMSKKHDNPIDKAKTPEVPKNQPIEETPSGDTAQVIDLDAVRASERKATLSYVNEINELCALAGQTDLATGFIAKAMPIAQVRKTLLEARAADDEATAIRTQKTGIVSNDTEPVIDTAAIYAARNKRNQTEGT